MARRKHSKDQNHNEIFDMIGIYTAVRDFSACGGGIPDGAAWIKTGWQFFDVKNPNTAYGRNGLNDLQKQWSDDWRGGPVFLIYTIEQAQRFAKGELDDLERYPDCRTGLVEIPHRGIIA